MIAKDLMTTTIVTTTPDAGVVEAVECMLRQHVSGLPVIDASGALVGIITEGDLMRRAELSTELHRTGFAEVKAGEERVAIDYVRAHGKRVGQVMTQKLFTVPEDAEIKTIVDIMDRHNVQRVPVVDGKKLLGVVSRTDLLRALVTATRHPSQTQCSDAEIKQKLLSLYTRESWAPLAHIDVTVSDGIVELTGAVDGEAQRSALIAAAEEQPGVKGVRDKLMRSSGQQAKFGK